MGPLFVTAVDDVNPFIALLTRDWAEIGGWSLFLGFCVFIVIGSFREWWVPGRRYRRMEEAADKADKANDELLRQNGQLITSNEIVKHFFEETTPKRREHQSDELA